MDRRHFMGGIVDRVEVGRVTRQEEQLGAGAADQLANRLALIAARLSMMTRSPALRVGTRNCST